MFPISSATIPPGPIGTEAVGTLEEWMQEQSASMDTDRPKIESNDLMQREPGLYMIVGDDNIAHIYVPPDRRQALIRVIHEGHKVFCSR